MVRLGTAIVRYGRVVSFAEDPMSDKSPLLLLADALEGSLTGNLSTDEQLDLIDEARAAIARSADRAIENPVDTLKNNAASTD